MSKILVVGDVMIDEYIQVAIERISPEAPIPVMRYLSTEYRPGGAANVAANIESMGGHSSLVGVIGLNVMFPVGIEGLSRCVSDPSRPTTIKRRFVADRGQQVARLDIEDASDVSVAIETALIHTALDDLATCDAVIISDYCKGVVTTRLAYKLIDAAGGRPIIVDTKRPDWNRFSGATIFTPNEREYHHHASISSHRGYDVVVTLGDRGAQYHGEIIPAEKVQVADVTGAGDTFVAALALALADKASTKDAIKFAIKAAGIAVSQRGTTQVRL